MLTADSIMLTVADCQVCHEFRCFLILLVNIIVAQNKTFPAENLLYFTFYFTHNFQQYVMHISAAFC